MSGYMGRDYLQEPTVRSGTSSPDGVVSAPKGTLYVNTSTSSVYQNTDGATSWRVFGARQIGFSAGRYYVVPVGNTTSSNSLGNGTLRLTPVYIPSTVTLAKIGAEVTTAGESGSKFRLGIYADDGTGRPGMLVLDAGQIAGDSQSLQELTISQSLAPGWYWFGGVVQSAPSSQPTIRIASNPSVPLIDVGGSLPASLSATGYGWTMSNVTAELPSTFVPATTSASVPRIVFGT